MGLAVGVAVGLGDTVGVGVGDGVGVGEVKAFPLNEPGLVESGAPGRDVVAFELNAIHLPSLLITGRVLTMVTRMLENAVGSPVGSKRTLCVSVIWNMRRCA